MKKKTLVTKIEYYQSQIYTLHFSIIRIDFAIMTDKGVFILFETVYFSIKILNNAFKVRNNAFKADEEVKMKVFYSTLGMYVGAGEAVFTSSLERYNGKPVYHLVGTGTTYSFFDGFFKEDT